MGSLNVYVHTHVCTCVICVWNAIFTIHMQVFIWSTPSCLGKQPVCDDIRTKRYLTSLHSAKLWHLNSLELHEKIANIKTYWAAAMCLAWWWPSRTKPCPMIHHLWIFEKVLYLPLPLLWLMDYHERQRSWFVRVSGSKVDAENVDFVYVWKWLMFVRVRTKLH